MPNEREKKREIVLSMADELIRVCEAYELAVFMEGRTLLGAVRQQGFIPYDHDMNFCMPREDFDKLLAVAPEAFQSPYYLQTLKNTKEIFNTSHAVLRNSDTTEVRCARDLYKKENQGVAIDILVMDYTSEKECCQSKQFYLIDRYEAMLFMKAYGNTLHKETSLVLPQWKRGLFLLLTRLCSVEYLQNKLIQAYTMQKSPTSRLLMGHQLDQYRQTVYDTADFDHMIGMTFEGHQYPAPVGYSNILTQLHGEDYMSCPVAEIPSQRYCGVVREDISYRDYLPHFWWSKDNLQNKRVIVFGAGEIAKNFAKSTKCKIEYYVDNNPNRWGTKVFDQKVISPTRLCKLIDETVTVVICSIYYLAVSKQLESLGINNYYIYVQNPEWL